MSATILYQAVKGRALSIGAPSSFLAMLGRVLQRDPPWVLADGTDALRLRIAADITDDAEWHAALERLVDAIEEHGTIRVWAEY